MAEFMKVRMAVEKYHIGKGVFYDAIHSGELKAYKPNKRDYLLKSTEIEAWIESKIAQEGSHERINDNQHNDINADSRNHP